METNVMVKGHISRDDSRPQRFAKTGLGLPFATLVGIGSTVELVAMPIPAPEAQLLGPTLIQQPTGGISGSVVGSHQKASYRRRCAGFSIDSDI